jgi:hypothetical protein
MRQAEADVEVGVVARPEGAPLGGYRMGALPQAMAHLGVRTLKNQSSVTHAWRVK